MAAAGPPPPNGDDFSPFKSGCNSSGGSRPTLRRAKTLANPEWTRANAREPLQEITNQVLAGTYRLQRVPIPTLTAPAVQASTLASSPTPSPRPSRRLRRTQSDIPTSSPFGLELGTPSSDLAASITPPASPLAVTRTRRRTTANTASPATGAAPAAARPSRARTTTAATTATGDSARATGSSRRTRSSLPVVLEDDAGEGDGDAQRRLRRRRTSTGGFR